MPFPKVKSHELASCPSARRTPTVAGGSRAAIQRGATRGWSASVVVVVTSNASVAPHSRSLRDDRNP
jgi:hypothetical protein